MATPLELYRRIDAAGTTRVGPRTTTTPIPYVYSSGKRVTFEIVPTAPAELASLAGVPLETYSLARMVSGEEGSHGAAHLLAVAECTRNYARKRGSTITSLLTRSSKGVAVGNYGEQASGRWATTRVDPLGRHVEAARIALEGSSAFGGVLDFTSPAGMDAGTQNGHAVEQTVKEYIESRAVEGLAWIGPREGIDPYKLMLFGPAARPVSTAPAIAALSGGRALETATKVGSGVLGVVGVVVVVGGILYALSRWGGKLA